MIKLIFIIIFCYVSTAFAQVDNSSIVIWDVNIVSVDDGQITPHQKVYIRDGIIKRISPMDDKVDDGMAIIPGSNKYLVPGISEMHAHIPTPQEGDDTRVRETLFLYLANGITTIRGMLGDPYHLDLKKQVKENHFPSPTIYTSSPSLNGNTIPNKETARSLVSQYAKDGYDFLKVHPGIKREVFDEMVATANELGITFSGHVPMDVGIEHAIASKYASIDHLDGYIEGLAPVEMRDQGGFFGVLLAENCNEEAIQVLVQKTKDAEVAVVPTQTLMTRWLSPRAPELMVQEPEMVYIPASMRFNWRQNKQQMLNSLQYSDVAYNRFIHLRHQLIRAFQKNGVPILLGSDAPQVFNVPGFSIHHEMQSMADAGLSNLEILQSGTINVAEFFGLEEKSGRIKPGMQADLIIIDENPLEDIAAMQKIHSVIYRGHLLSKNDIVEGLLIIEDRHKTN